MEQLHVEVAETHSCPHRYYVRAKAIENNEKDGYFDPYGPPVLAALLTVIILLTVINAFKR